MKLLNLAGLCVLSAWCASAETAPAPAPSGPVSDLPPDLARRLAPAPPHRPERPLLFTGSFEAPVVTASTPIEQGGNPVMRLGPREWVSLQIHQSPSGGKLITGLTNEAAHTGKQSLYFDFQKVTAPEVSAEFATAYVPIVPGGRYRCVVWGMIDKKRPLTLDQRLAFLRLQVDFLQEDKKNGAGESILKIQPIPGGRTHPLFLVGKWAQFSAEIAAPENASYLRTSWLVSTPPQAGETDGILYLDDANILGEPGKSIELSPAEREAQTASALKEALKAAQPASAPAEAEATPKPKPVKKAR